MPSPELTDGVWPRGRLILGLIAVVAGAGVVLMGCVLAIVALIAPGSTEVNGPGSEPPVSGEELRDVIAASPLPEAARDAAWPHAPAVVPPAEIVVPSATAVGAAGVVSGFPQTPEGALGQLAAIEVRVLEAMDLRVLAGVHAGWVMPSGPGLAEWEMAANVQAFLGAVPHEEPDRIDDVTTVTVVPVGAQVKGTDGEEWVLACVMVEVRATVVTDARMAYGHCARMAWNDDAWRIAAGTPPPPVAGVWPGTQEFIDAGWLTWRETWP